MNQHPEIIAAPFTIWIAPLGTAFPATDEEPAGPWVLLGSNGERSYNEAGVTFEHRQTWTSPPPPAGETASGVTMLESEALLIRLELLDVTIEHYALALGAAGVSVIAEGPGIAGSVATGLSVGPRAVQEFALLARGPSPYAEELNAQFEIPRCAKVSSPQVVYRKGRPAGLAFEFTALADPAATSAATRFGRLIGQSSVPLPPLFTVAPAISGNVWIGETLTATIGTFEGGSITARQWLKDGIPIVGATGSTYLVDAADVGGTITHRVTLDGPGGTTVGTSAGVGPVLFATNSMFRHGATFNFSANRPAGQYANGDIWVLGPVTITSISPASTLHDGLNGDGTSYTGRTVHGAMVNPGNRAFATGGLLANNTTNTVQGWDSIGSSKPRVPYSAPANVDPGATGSPLVVSEGSVVKFVSALTGLPNGAENRPAGLDMAVLTVVSSIPAADAVRPGVSRTSKASPARESQFNLAVFNNFTPTASAPTYAQALDWVDRYIEVSQPDSINNPVAKAINNHPEYGRDIGNNLHRALLALHLNYTAKQKQTLLCHLAAIADDIVSRAEEGSITLGAGGGNAFKKAVIAVCAASLGSNAPASWLTYLSFANRNVWCEDSQIFNVIGRDVALDRFTADGRPRDPYTTQMLGSADWGEQPTIAPNGSGSNWSAVYRDIVAYSVYPGALAVELTTGAKALWDHPAFWLYMDSVFGRRTEGGSGNQMLAFGLEMTNTYRPANTAVPAIVEAGVRDAAVWLRFDRSLLDNVTAPATSAFTVFVNGIARTVTAVSVFRQNIGLTLASAVSASDLVTVGYTVPGTNPARSVDGINVASFVGRILTNRTDPLEQTNTAFPVVRFVAGAQPRINSPVGGGTTTAALAPTNGPTGTFALLKYKFAALPASDSEIFGNSAASLSFRLFQKSNGRFELRLTNAAGTIIARAETPVLAANTEYDMLWSWDVTQTTATNGINCYINGTLQTLNITAWSGGAGVVVGYNVTGAAYTFNFSNNMVWEMGAFWLDVSARLDLSVAGNRSKFTTVTAGNLEILTRGDGITGSIPAHFLVGTAAQWNDTFGIQRGTGGRFFNTTTPVTAVSGSDWGAFTVASIFAGGEQGYDIDPSDFSTMFQDAAGTVPVTAVGQSVGRINDKSGRGNHWHQPSNPDRPVLQQDSGGNYFLTGGAMQTIAPINPGSDKLQLVTGLRKTTDAAAAIVTEFSANGSTTAGAFYFAAPENTGAAGNYSTFGRGAGASPPVLGSGVFLAPDQAVISLIYDIAGDSRVIRRNGVQVASSAADLGTGNFTTQTMYLLRRNGASLQFPGRFYRQVCRFGPNLAAGQIAALERVMNSRTGAF